MSPGPRANAVEMLEDTKNVVHGNADAKRFPWQADPKRQSLESESRADKAKKFLFPHAKQLCKFADKLVAADDQMAPDCLYFRLYSTVSNCLFNQGDAHCA